jgi:hypothetical protein
MFMETFNVGKKLPVVDMETSLIVAHEYPFVFYDLASKQFGSFAYVSYLLS